MGPGGGWKHDARRHLRCDRLARISCGPARGVRGHKVSVLVRTPARLPPEVASNVAITTGDLMALELGGYRGCPVRNVSSPCRHRSMDMNEVVPITNRVQTKTTPPLETAIWPM